MLNVYLDSKSKTTTAVVCDSELDVSKKVLKRMGIGSILDDSSLSDKTVYNIMEGLCLNKLNMPRKNKATVRCDARDEFSTEAGRKEAITKVQRNYFESAQKAIRRWQTAMIKKVYTVNPETFQRALEKANDDIARSNRKLAAKLEK